MQNDYEFSILYRDPEDDPLYYYINDGESTIKHFQE
jgi:hypothetical protein